MKIVVLAGGKGTRLGLTDRPKPMVSVGGKPLLERLIDVGRAAGFRDFVFLNGYLAEVIESHFGDGERFGVHIEHIREPLPLGTAGAVRHAQHLLTEPFVVVYGDVLIDVDLAHFVNFHRDRGGLGSLFVHPNDHPYDSDLIEKDSSGRITAFLSKPHFSRKFLPNLVNAALYVLDPDAINYVPREKPSDWGKDVFPAILADGKTLHAYRSMEYVKDVGTLDRLADGEVDLSSGRIGRLSRRHAKPAIFFDRDGVLNNEIGGVHHPNDLVLRDGVGTALKTVNRTGIPGICITNQPDVAKGLLSFSDLRDVFAALDTRLAEYGAYLDDVYCCPHHPERGWPNEVESLKIKCHCRKPEPGLLLEAARNHNIDLSRSWLIGDRHSDVAAAHGAGARAVLLRPVEGSNKDESTPDFITDHIADAVEYVLGAIK